jgi:hypothetical protein
VPPVPQPAEKPAEKKKESGSVTPIIAGGLCAALLASLLILYYHRQSHKVAGKDSNSLNEALLQNDGLEMGTTAAAASSYASDSPGTQAISLYPVVGGAGALCKVLVTGEATADIRGIEAALVALSDSSNTTIEVTTQAVPMREQTQLDSFLTATLSDFNAIIVAIDASQIWLNVIGAGGSATGMMDKCGFHGIPSEAIYFVATGDTSAPGMSPSELVSEDLKHKLGPMQLNVLADYIQYGRFLSWQRQPEKQQVDLLSNHLQYLARNKPQSQIDPARFLCAMCRDKLPMKYLRERSEEDHDFKTRPTLCIACSSGHCPTCGDQITPAPSKSGKYSWDNMTGCDTCGESSSTGGQAALLKEILGKTDAELRAEKTNKTATFPRTGSHLGAISFDVPEKDHEGAVAPATTAVQLKVERL